MDVGYKLYRQIRDHAPRDWTSGELVVAWVIADDANDETRRSFIPTDEFCRRARMSESGIRKALAKLAERGFEFRVSKGKGKDGREVYATRGCSPEYMVPDIFQLIIRAAGVAYGLVDNHPEGGTVVLPSGWLSTGEGGTVVQRRRDCGPGLRGACLLLEISSLLTSTNSEEPDLTHTGGRRKVVHRRNRN